MAHPRTVQILREGAPGTRRRGITACRACGHKMLWCTTVAGKPMPFDVMPEPIAVQGDVETVSAEHVHWYTCTRPASFRRPPAPAGESRQKAFDEF